MSSVGDLRAADPGRLFADHPDLLPRLQPHRHPGQRARRRRARRLQRPLPDRRRRAVRRPSRGQAGLRSRLDLAACRRSGRCATRGASCPAARSRPRRRCSSAPPRTPSRRPTISARSTSPRRSPPAPSSCRPSTASTCRCLKRFMAQVARHGARQGLLHPGRRRPPRLGKTARWMRANVAGRAHPRRHHRAARRRCRTRRPRASALHRPDPGDPRDRRACRACM